MSFKHNVVLRFAGALLTVGSLLALPAFAQGSAVITGTVVDASTKQPVPDVVVTATSPALQGEQIVVTDSTGLYRIPQLNPGVYTIRLEKESYRPFSRGEITLRAGTTTRVNIDLLPEALQATTEVVVGRPPTVDIGSSTTGTTVGQDFVKNIAVARPGGVGGSARSFESLALTTPQASGDSFGVGISGATSAENTYQVDGINVNNSAYGINGSPLTIEFVDEVNVVTGGYMPEYGRSSGGTVSATTKSGGNEFHGEIYGNLSPGIFNGTRKTVNSAVSMLSTNIQAWNIGDFGAQLGGYIVKDKLWFFAGVQPSFSRSSLHVNYNVAELDSTGARVTDADGNPIRNKVGPGFTKFADDRTVQYIGKLTYLFNQDTRVSLTVTGTPEWSGGNGSFSYFTGNAGPSNSPRFSVAGPFDARAVQSLNNSNDVNLKLASSFLDKRLLLDVSLGWHNQGWEDKASDGSTVGSTTGRAGRPRAILSTGSTGGQLGPLYLGGSRMEFPLPADVEAACSDMTGISGASLATVQANRCGVASWNLGGPGLLERVILNNYQAKGVLTYLLNAAGHHVIKGGADFLYQSYDSTKGYSGGGIYTQTTAAADGGERWNITRAYAFPTDTAGNAAFQLSRRSVVTTSNVGAFIQDSWSILDLITLNAGVRYDAQQLYDASGRLAMTLSNQWSPRVGLIYDFTQAGRSKLFANYARYVQGVPLDLADRALSGEKQIGGRVFGPSPAHPDGCDPSLGACTLTAANTVARLRSPTSHYIHQFGFDPDTIDPDLQPMTENEVVAGGEYEVIANGRVGATYTHRFLENIIEDMSNDNVTAFIGNPGRGIAKNFTKPQRDYDAVTVYFTKSFADLWLGQVSYTYSRLFGNYPGLFQASNGQLDPGISSAFDLVPLLANRTGFLDGDITHSIKAYLAKDFVLPGGFDINLGASYVGASGVPSNYLGYNGAQSYGAGEVFILPRGSGPRLPWVHTIDGRIAVNYRLGKDSQATLSLDVFNLFNFQQAVAVDEEYTLDPQGVLPIAGGTVADLPSKLTSDDPADAPFFVNPNSPTAEETAKILNKNFGNPTQFQSPRSMRIGVKVTF